MIVIALEKCMHSTAKISTRKEYSILLWKGESQENFYRVDLQSKFWNSSRCLANRSKITSISEKEEESSGAGSTQADMSQDWVEAVALGRGGGTDMGEVMVAPFRALWFEQRGWDGYDKGAKMIPNILTLEPGR